MIKPKVLLVTRWEDSKDPRFKNQWRCGGANFAEKLIKNVPEVEYKIIPWEFPPYQVKYLDFDILHLNFAEFAPIEAWAPILPSLRKKKILQLHQAWPTGNRSDWTDLFDAVIVNQDVAHEAPNFRYIPQAITEVPIKFHNESGKVRIAAHGFPQSFKLFTRICLAASQITNSEVVFLCARSEHANVDALEHTWKSILQNRTGLTVIKDWLPYEDIAYELQKCSVGVFGCIPDKGGQSDAILSAIAAGLPLVVSDSWHFEAVKDHCYVGDFYNIDSLAETIKLANKERKIALSLTKTMSWSITADMYREVYTRD